MLPADLDAEREVREEDREDERPDFFLLIQEHPRLAVASTRLA